MSGKIAKRVARRTKRATKARSAGRTKAADRISKGTQKLRVKNVKRKLKR